MSILFSSANNDRFGKQESSKAHWTERFEASDGDRNKSGGCGSIFATMLIIIVVILVLI